MLKQLYVRCLKSLLFRATRLDLTERDIHFLHDPHQLVSTLSHLENNYGHLQKSNESPIFLLSAGWRSGSTLMQRLIMSNPNVLLWGEPYSDGRIIQHLARQFACFPEGYPYENVILDEKEIPGAGFDESWIAYLFPKPKFLYSAHLQFMNSLLKEPAVLAGFTTWGLKEVRLTGYHALYLKWLYPKAKFIFLIRDLEDCWTSYKGKGWFLEFPSLRIEECKPYCELWLRQINSFATVRSKLRHIVVRYEELLASKDSEILRLEAFLDLKIDSSVMGKKVSGFSKAKGPLSRVEKKLISSTLERVEADF
jgi:hypothetical protein